MKFLTNFFIGGFRIGCFIIPGLFFGQVIKDTAQTKVLQEKIVDTLVVNAIPQIRETITDSLSATKTSTSPNTSGLNPQDRIKIDGVAAVIGEYVILDSDVAIAYQQLVSEGVSASEVGQCELAGSLFENKLYAHHAVQDSIEISDAEINAMVDQQLAYMKNELGTIQKILQFYKKDSEEEFRKELFDINKSNRLSEKMRSKIIEEVEVTPEEVRSFYDKIPEEERPLFGTELELAQIVIDPKVPEEEEEKVIQRLREFREDIVENGSSFATKAVLYSQDPGSKSTGGKYTITRQTGFAKEFKDVAFSLQEGEVSEPFQTDFGWHIVKVDRIRGEEIDVRHILLIPEVTRSSVNEAKKLVDSIRTAIIAGSIKFKEAARKFSDEKETREDGGQLLNPTTGDTRFELTKIDPILYDQVSKLTENEVSKVIPDQDRQGKPKFKLITVLNRFDEHIADYAKDYLKVQELALRKKQIDAIRKWQEEKINDTYIKINGDYRECEYSGNWLKTED
ncbi:peptidylprolyl isomerase [Aquimarina sp. ERC-38]|nr:peptidylprolyl isomerase [Aquimarina sp. ERC-38]UZO80422.1 peptidylprolyl isomerase [Aquimarina sp. ERC-38]